MMRPAKNAPRARDSPKLWDRKATAKQITRVISNKTREHYTIITKVSEATINILNDIAKGKDLKNEDGDIVKYVKINDDYIYPEAILGFGNIRNIDTKTANKIIGFGLVKDRDFDTHLDLLCIHPSYRNKGCSRILMEKIINSLIEQEITTLTLGVDPNNFAALSLYKKLGFKKINSIVELRFISN